MQTYSDAIGGSEYLKNGNSEGVDIEDFYPTSAIGLAHQSDTDHGSLYVTGIEFQDAYTIQLWSYQITCASFEASHLISFSTTTLGRSAMNQFTLTHDGVQADYISTCSSALRQWSLIILSARQNGPSSGRFLLRLHNFKGAAQFQTSIGPLKNLHFEGYNIAVRRIQIYNYALDWSQFEKAFQFCDDSFIVGGSCSFDADAAGCTELSFFDGTDCTTQCDPSCLFCGSSPTQCTSCDASLFLNGNTCINDCGFQTVIGNTCANIFCPPPNYGWSTADVRYCKVCHSSCSTCTFGVLKDSCISCPSSYTLQNGHCTTAQNCPTNCLKCISPNECIHCDANSKLHNGSCVSSSTCPSGFYLNSASLECEPCASNCSECTDIAPGFCNKCQLGYSLINAICIKTSCTAQQFASGTCSQCQATCKTCDMYSSRCLQCSQGYALDQLTGDCIIHEVCGDGIFFPGGTQECDDGNTENGDGCSSICTIEEKYECQGYSPSVCSVHESLFITQASLSSNRKKISIAFSLNITVDLEELPSCLVVILVGDSSSTELEATVSSIGGVEGYFSKIEVSVAMKGWFQGVSQHIEISQRKGVLFKTKRGSNVTLVEYELPTGSLSYLNDREQLALDVITQTLDIASIVVILLTLLNYIFKIGRIEIVWNFFLLLQLMVSISSFSLWLPLNLLKILITLDSNYLTYEFYALFPITRQLYAYYQEGVLVTSESQFSVKLFLLNVPLQIISLTMLPLMVCLITLCIRATCKKYANVLWKSFFCNGYFKLIVFSYLAVLLAAVQQFSATTDDIFTQISFFLGIFVSSIFVLLPFVLMNWLARHHSSLDSHENLQFLGRMYSHLSDKYFMTRFFYPFQLFRRLLLIMLISLSKGVTQWICVLILQAAVVIYSFMWARFNRRLPRVQLIGTQLIYTSMLILNYGFLEPGHKFLGYVQIGLFGLCYFYNFIIFLIDILQRLKEKYGQRKKKKDITEVYHIQIKREDQGMFPEGSRVRQNYIKKMTKELKLSQKTLPFPQVDKTVNTTMSARSVGSSKELVDKSKRRSQEYQINEQDELVEGRRRNALALAEEDDDDWRLNVLVKTNNQGLLDSKREEVLGDSQEWAKSVKDLRTMFQREQNN